MIEPANLRVIRIIADKEHPRGIVVDVATGQPVPQLVSATVHLNADRAPSAELSCVVHEVTMPTRVELVNGVAVEVEAQYIKWWGLEDVPVDALRAELARREEEHPPEVSG